MSRSTENERSYEIHEGDKMIGKIRNYLFRRKIQRKGIQVHICGHFECRNPDGLHLGEYIYIGPGAKLWGTGDMYIGNNVIIGPNLTAITTNHDFRGEMLPYGSKAVNKDIVIGDNVWIASNVNIVPGVVIGEGAIISMGTTVTKDVPPLSIVGSNSLTVIGRRDEDEYRRKVRENCLYLVKKYRG